MKLRKEKGEMRKELMRIVVSLLAALMVIGMVPIVSRTYATPAPSMWIEPSSIELNTAEYSVGYRFWVTVSLNATDFEVGAWQFYMIYEKAYLNVIDFTLTGTGGAISQFFENVGAATWGMTVAQGSYDETHDYIQIGESWKSGPWGTGVGSLATVQFEVVSVPPKGGEIRSLIDISTGFANGDTVALDPSMSNILAAAYDCTYIFTWVAPPAPRVGVSPTSQEFGMFDNVIGWPVDVDVYILGLDAAWYLVSASFTLSYDPTLVGVTADDIILNTADWNVAAEATVTDGNITFYVETDKLLSGDVKVADITFTILYQGDYPEVNVCPLEFYDVHLFDHTMEIPTEAPLEGEIRIIGYIALPMPHLEVEPTEVVFGPEPSLGKEFSINVVMKQLYEAWNLVGYNFRLSYNDTLLEVVDVQEGPFLAEATSWGYVLFEDITLPAAAPPLYMSNITLILRVNATLPQEYDFEVVAPDGIRVLINYTARTTFSVAGPTVEDFIIEFRNYNDYPITGDYKIICTPTTYGVTLYNITDPANPIELEWIRNVAKPPYTWFFSNVQPDGIYGPHVVVGGMLATDTGEWYIFPEGEGVLATITFRIIKQAPTPGTSLTCPLNLFDIVLIDKEGKDIPYEPPVNGTYTVLSYELPGRQIDLYTQYPAPYGGQGPNNPSDMFIPQQNVTLYAKVTYNWWGMENKLVGFEVLNNHGETWGKFTGITNSEGIAECHFTMPSYNPDLFGVWTAIATADIAGETVTDTLQFHFDTLVEIADKTVDKINCAHGDTVEVTVTLTSHAMQPRVPVEESWHVLANLTDDNRYNNVNATITKVSEPSYEWFTIEIESENIPHPGKYGVGLAFSTSVSTIEFQVFYAEWEAPEEWWEDPEYPWYYQEYPWDENPAVLLNESETGILAERVSEKVFSVRIPIDMLGGRGATYYFAIQFRTNLLGAYPEGLDVWGQTTAEKFAEEMCRYNVLVAITLTDELGFVVASAEAYLLVEGAEFCTPSEYEIKLTFTIPHEAVAGIATIHINCFDKEPIEGGVSLCPEATYEIFIQPI